MFQLPIVMCFWLGIVVFNFLFRWTILIVRVFPTRWSLVLLTALHSLRFRIWWSENKTLHYTLTARIGPLIDLVFSHLFFFYKPRVQLFILVWPFSPNYWLSLKFEFFINFAFVGLLYFRMDLSSGIKCSRTLFRVVLNLCGIFNSLWWQTQA